MQDSKSKEIVFLNDRFISLEEAKLSVFTTGFFYGFGLFETMRSYHNKIVYLDQHLKRIKNSCRLIGIRLNYPADKLKDMIKKTIAINKLKDAYVRLTLWKSVKGTDILIWAKTYKRYPSLKYNRGFRVCISGYRQNENSFFSQHKTISRLFYEFAFQQAKQKGYDESIVLNNRGYITECSRSNIFFIKDKQLFTPSLSSGCLAGITRRVVFDLAKKYNIKIYEGNLTLQDLYEADEAFLTNSLLGIMPLAWVERHRLARGVSNFKLTRFFIREYNSLLKNVT
jgi:branched-subunit amino acid aminotransferase/4-amino-4-deoxychorismate lyase